MNNKRILIVDDSLIVLKALRFRLSRAGFEVVTATDGSEALDMARRQRPNLVIVDVNFPPDISQGGVAWDGFRVIEWLRHTGSAGIAPVIIITSDDIQEHRNRALAVGAAALFQKPVSVPDLMETIEECFAAIPQTHCGTGSATPSAGQKPPLLFRRRGRAIPFTRLGRPTGRRPAQASGSREAPEDLQRS